MSTSTQQKSRIKSAIITAAASLLLTACTSSLIFEGVNSKPAKPSLPSITVNADGGITLSKQDTERLMKYILELEQGYE